MDKETSVGRHFTHVYVFGVVVYVGVFTFSIFTSYGDHRQDTFTWDGQPYRHVTIDWDERYIVNYVRGDYSTQDNYKGNSYEEVATT